MGRRDRQDQYLLALGESTHGEGTVSVLQPPATSTPSTTPARASPSRSKSVAGTCANSAPASAAA